jgi:hypothetical protein
MNAHQTSLAGHYEKNEQIALAKKQRIAYVPQLLPNGDSPKQLLARSRYLLF